MLRKLLVREETMSLTRSRLRGEWSVATRERIESRLGASRTERVPSAEALRPVNGKGSGPRRQGVEVDARDLVHHVVNERAQHGGGS